MKKTKNKNVEKPFKMFLPFVIIIIIIFLIAVLLSWGNINRLFARLGFGPSVGIMAQQQEFTYTISSTQLSAGEVVGYYSFANDSSGNWNTTNTTPGSFRTFIVIFPENITDIHIENETHLPATNIIKGHQFYVSFNVSNQRTSSVTRRYIVQVVDPDSRVTQSLVSSRTTVSPGTEGKIDVSYTAVKSGLYTAQVFVWTGWLSAPESGFSIAPSKLTNFNSI